MINDWATRVHFPSGVGFSFIFTAMSIMATGLIKQPMLKAPKIFLQTEVTGPITEENGTQE